MTGLFYVVSYSGFALPFVLNTYEDRIGPSAPLVVLAVLGHADRGRSAGGRRAERARSNNVDRQVRLTTTPPWAPVTSRT